ncbi:unnamed protein product [Adineta steineri]|uniref:Uncharacterized protein n=1 Tax=Adineta steineri TaxID=433720 RepID=A0A814AZ69_9BILA|nr:unnamed protein product [Adineta steineri]
MKAGRNLMKEMFTIPRNRRAAQSSFLVMFMQQFCGVNIIMYYSSVIFVNAGVSANTAILASLGAGILNFLFALPAIKIIDTWGRRPLLLWTFPIMSICLFFTGFCFWIESESVRLGLVVLGIYLFMIAYSPGEGPVPFTYAAEAFPLYIRDFVFHALQKKLNRNLLSTGTILSKALNTNEILKKATKYDLTKAVIFWSIICIIPR